MTLILEKTNQVEYHTDMNVMIQPFREELKSMNWFLSNQDYMLLDYEEKGDLDKLNHESPVIFFDGSELLEILESRSIQFNWGVFCGTYEKVNFEDDQEIPYADSNPSIWTQPSEFLYPGSQIEIICFDSTSTIVKFRDRQLAEKWNAEFIDAEELTI